MVYFIYGVIHDINYKLFFKKKSRFEVICIYIYK